MEARPEAFEKVPGLSDAIRRGVSLLFSQQNDAGHWWYTLEANETIGAGFIQLMHFLGEVDPQTEAGLVTRILSEQRDDGSWPLFYEGPGDLSTTIECTLALRLAGLSPDAPPLTKARGFILQHGGLTKARVFTRIHLALFGLVPWSSCPAMPVWFVLLPVWLRISIYEFSSWARASIVPLLIVLTKKPVRNVSFDLEELYGEPPDVRDFRFPKGLFTLLDGLLKVAERLPWHPGRKRALRRAEQWTREHIERTEDIYPAMAYAAIAISAIGHPITDPTIQKALNGLRRFQQRYTMDKVSFFGDCRERSQMQGVCESPTEAYLSGTPQGNSPACRGRCPEGTEGADGIEQTTQQMGLYRQSLHQQCCISPNWDTPWAGVALIEAGVDPEDPRLLKAARYMIGGEIRNFRGDWRFKNPSGAAGGWSFEIQNDFFPDIDDTIEAIFFLKKVGLPPDEKKGPIERGLNWLLSMQSKNGGWAAFDKDNLAGWVNRIPFADHGACLDPPTPDITGRMIELLSLFGFRSDDPVVVRALNFLKKTQEGSGAWRGRWGVNYIYGTWCVLQGFRAIGEDSETSPFQKALRWVQSIQNNDGGWGESCLSDKENRYVPLGVSVPSQTAWAVMALTDARGGEEKDSISVQRGIQWLIENQEDDGGWKEPYYTGTGFPGHFYLRYHGYRYYFPLLALGRCKNLIST